MTLQDQAHTDAQIETGLRLSRRRAIQGAAWSVPVISVATAAPAFAGTGGPGTTVLFTTDFDSVGTALPAGFTVRTGATAVALGTETTHTTAATAWNSTTGRFANFAAADGFTSTATVTQQNGSTDRAIGLRQTGSLGDPGGAFVVQVDTTGIQDVTASFRAQSLDASSGRTTTWTVDAFAGGSQVLSGTTFQLGGSAFSNTTINAVFPASLNNAGIVFIRIVTLAGSTGSGNRATSAIDDLTIYGTPIP